MNHVHHDLIVAWAKGATIQWKGSCGPEDWRNCSQRPAWDKDVSYRIKPEPKPDVSMYGCVMMDDTQFYTKLSRAAVMQAPTDTCMFIFDGETGKLKDAQVLASSDK